MEAWPGHAGLASLPWARGSGVAAVGTREWGTEKRHCVELGLSTNVTEMLSGTIRAHVEW